MALLLSGLLALAFTVQPAKAVSGTIYINPDGSISSPVTANITSIDNVTYTFTGINYLPIVVNRSSIIINGMGYTLQVSGQNGFSLKGISHVTIENTTITNGYNDIYLDSSSSCTVSGNNITNSTYSGVCLYSSSNITVSGNNMASNELFNVYLYNSSENTLSNNTIVAAPGGSQSGIWLEDSSNNFVSGNTISGVGPGPHYGIYLHNSWNNSISANGMAGCDYGIFLWKSSSNNIAANNLSAILLRTGIYLNYSYNNVVSANSMLRNGFVATPPYGNMVVNNTVNGRPLVYLVNASDGVVRQAGEVILVNCSHMLVESCNLSQTNFGAELWQTNDTTITGNNMTATPSFGVWLVGSYGDIVSDNNIAGGYDGVILTNSLNNSISQNNLADNYLGVQLKNASNNLVCENNMFRNVYAVVKVSNDSSHNRIYHNNFFNNPHVPPPLGTWAVDEGSFEAWDNGYPSGGNYWSDYKGVDAENGPGQNLTGSDGIGDTPYNLNFIPYTMMRNVDRYPLMAPFKSSNVTWNNQTYPINTVTGSMPSSFSFDAMVKTLSFNVTGTSGTVGFCRIAIPLSLMSCANLQDWLVTVNGTLVSNRTAITDANYTYIYFTYHQSTEQVQIQSTSAVPEFQPFMLLSLFMVIALFGVMILKRKQTAKK